MRRNLLFAAAAALSLPAFIWKPRPVRAAEVPAVIQPAAAIANLR